MTADGKSWLTALPSKIFVLAAAYFIVGMLTLAANIPPVIDTVVWLPAGISLTATLVWGYRVWPGILLGAFAAQAAVHLDLTGGGTPFMTLVISALIGLGAVLQSFAGAYLILRFGGFPRSLNRLREADILLFGGPVGCLVGAAVGGTASMFAGSTPVLSLVGQWWNWWMAETLGVLIILPFVSVWLSERHRISLHMRLFVILPVCLAAVLTILAFQEIRAGKWNEIQAEFTRQAQIMATTLGSNFESYVDVLYSIKGLFDSSETVDRQEFQIFVQRLFDRHFGIQALEWIPRVTYEQRNSYEVAARRAGFSEFQITERQSQGQMVPVARRPEYFPVYYVEPYAGNELALGFDLASNPARRTAISRSRDTGKLTATARITLVQEQEKQHGVAVFLPVYGQQGAPATVEARRAALRGFVLGVFRIDDMVTSALKAFDPDSFIYSLRDHTAPPGEQLLWEHHPAIQSNVGALLSHRQETNSAGLKFRNTYDLGGRSWTILFAPTVGYLATYRSWDVWTVLAGGLLFTSLVGTLLLAVVGRSAELSTVNASLQREIVERTQAEAKVRESSENFRGLVDSASDAILIVDHQGLITFANRQVKNIFGYQIGEILGQPHDILLPDRFRDIHARHRAAYHGKPDTRHMAAGREIFGLHKNGSEFPVEVGLSLFNAETNPQVISIVRDISERKRSEEALRKSEERYRALVSNLNTGVVVHASDTRILLANYRAQELLGLTEDQMLGKKDIDPAWHFLGDDGMRLPTKEYPVNVVISKRKPLTNYVAGIKNPKAKDIVWVIVNAFPEYDENYLLKQIVVTFWDYTQLKLAEAALAKRTYDLAKANRELQRQITERKLVEKELWKKQQQLAKDLEVAAGIQQSLMPSYSPRIESIRVAWRFEPCEQIGGDIFNFHYAGRNHISFYMLDVCGHGVSSALISAAASQFLQTNYELSANASETVQPEAVLNSLERVFPFERFDSFFTIVYVTVDYVNGRLVYSCAGHPPPILLHADGELEVLGMHGSVIGAGDGRPFRQEENRLEHGDKIILYTDGVLDYPNPAGKIFGKQRFHKALQKHGRQPVQTLMDSVQMTIKAFAGSASSGDDLTIMAIEYV
jgi:PAS domain S-box-containing protein